MYKGAITPLPNGDWVWHDVDDVASDYPRITFSVNTKPDLETEKARKEFLKNLALPHVTDMSVKDFVLPLSEIAKHKGNTLPEIKKVIFNDPATIVYWTDGTKTVVKCMEGDVYTKWSGLALCICKKLMGDDFHKAFKYWCKEDEIRSHIYDVRHTDPGCHSESVSHYGRDAGTSMLESFSKAADIINQLSDKL